MEQSNRYTFYHETKSHSGRRKCVTPIWSLAEFNCVAMFGGELTKSLSRWFVSQLRTQFDLTNFPRNNRASFPQSPKLCKAFRCQFDFR